jgi:probable HAF family extracellular repeat protein
VVTNGTRYQYTAGEGIGRGGVVLAQYWNPGEHHSGLVTTDLTTTLRIDFSGAQGTYATGIADAGNNTEYVVGYYIDQSAQTHSFLYTGSVNGGGSTDQNIDLFIPNQFGANTVHQTTAHGINESKYIVGSYQTVLGAEHGYLQAPNGTVTNIDDPLGANGTYAQGINNFNQVVGYYEDANFKIHGFWYSNGTYITLDDPSGAQGTFLEGINDSGQITGYYYDASGNSHGFIYDSSHVFTFFPSQTELSPNLGDGRGQAAAA